MQDGPEPAVDSNFMSHDSPSCVRLYPAHPGNPRTCIEG